MILNTKSGILHRYQRCAGQDRRFHYRVRDDGELVGFLYLKFTGICRKCCK